MAVRPPVLVIDSNMVFTDRVLRSPQWVALSEAVAAGEVEVAVPEVVVRETGRHSHQEEKRTRKAVQTALRELHANLDASRLAIEWPVLTSLPTVAELRSATPADDEHARNRFRTRLNELGFQIAPIPAASHDVLVDWSLRAHPPFDTTDKGYRDALIFHSVLEIADADPSRCVVFVSCDSDFLQHAPKASQFGPPAASADEMPEGTAVEEPAEPRAKVKDELAAILAARGFAAVEFARQIEDALKIAQQARTAEAAAEQLPAGRIRELLYQPTFDALLNLHGDRLLSMANDSEPRRRFLELPAGLSSPTIYEIGIPEPLFEFVRVGYQGTVVVGSAWTRPIPISYEALLSKSAYAALAQEERGKLSLLDPDWDETMVRVRGSLLAEAQTSFSIDPVKQLVLALEIKGLQLGPARSNHVPES